MAPRISFSALYLVADDASVPCQDERLAAGIEHEVVDVHRNLVLLDRLVRLQVEEHQKAVARPAGPEQPLALRVKFEVIHEPLELVAGELVGALRRLPVEDLDTGVALEVVDVADLADTADG